MHLSLSAQNQISVMGINGILLHNEDGFSFIKTASQTALAGVSGRI